MTILRSDGCNIEGFYYCTAFIITVESSHNNHGNYRGRGGRGRGGGNYRGRGNRGGNYRGGSRGVSFYCF